MPKITVLPNPKYCPEGAEFEMATGENLIRGLLSHGVKIEHACEMGFDSLEEPSDKEYDCLDKAWGVGALSRLSCQVKVGDEDLTIEVPKYTRNQVSEDD